MVELQLKLENSNESCFFRNFLLILISSPAIAANDTLFKQGQVSKTGHVPNDGIKPNGGFVPDATIATKIALAILEPIFGRDEVDKQKPFGRDEVDKQKPFRAELRGGVWIVQGSFEHSTGGAEVNISKRTGAILGVVHGK
ncbi:NTF2 fold immunity protein [Duganella sp. PWIR1]